MIANSGRVLSTPIPLEIGFEIAPMSSTEAIVKRRRQQSGRRSRTGCLCCRLRHKKCDEIKPTCGGCCRNSLICSWPQQESSNQYPVRPKWRRHLLSGSDNASSERTAHDDTSTVESGSNIWESEEPYQAEYQGNGGTESSLPQVESQNCLVVRRRPWQNKASPSINPGHLTLRDSNTSTLFAHYAAETAGPLCTRKDAENPFVTYILPRAYSDSLIMAAVIALSGVHFCHKIPNSDMLYTTWSYYAQTVRGLKHELTKMNGDESSVARLLFVTILLCHVEVRLQSIFALHPVHK